MEDTADGRQQLEAIDKALVAFSDRIGLKFIMLPAERVYVLHVAIMGKEAEARQKWSRIVAIVLGTCDKVRKCVQRKPWWARYRELDMLIVDEVEDQTMPELASLLSHFNQAYLGSDTRPALAKHRVSADGAVEQVEPEIEIMGEEKVQRSKRGGTDRVPPGYMLDQDGVFCFRPHPGSATQLRAPDTDEVSDDSDGNIVPTSLPPLCDSSSENEVGGPVPANEEDSSEYFSVSDLVELISHLGYNASESERLGLQADAGTHAKR